MLQTKSLEYTRSFENLIRNRLGAGDHSFLEDGSYNSDYYSFPEGFKGDYKESLAEQNLFRRHGRVLTKVSEGTIQTVTTVAEAKLTGEKMNYPEDGDEKKRLLFDAYKLATLMKLPLAWVQDMHFDLHRYLKEELVQRFGDAEEKLLLNGSGENEPEGLLQAAEPGVTTAEATLNSDELVALFFALEPRYRKRAIWIMNDRTAYFIRTLKDSSGRYLIESDMQFMLGRPLVISNFMPDMVAGAKPLVFADLSYFWLLERTPLSVQVLKEKYIVNGQIGFAAQERLDGKLIRTAAAKTLQIKA